MTKTLLAFIITGVALTVAQPAFAESITLVSNQSGVAGLAFADENGIQDEAQHPDTPGGPNSFNLTATVGGSRGSGAASIAADVSNLSTLRGEGTTSASYSTIIGQGEGHVSSFFFVFFELDRPHAFLFDGDFVTSGHASTPGDPRHLSDWRVSLMGLGPGGSQMPIFNEQGTDSIGLMRDGRLPPGLYRFLVHAGSFAANLESGAGSGEVFSNFAFSLDLDADPVPEPASLLLVGTGLGALVSARRRKRCAHVAVEPREV